MWAGNLKIDLVRLDGWPYLVIPNQVLHNLNLITIMTHWVT